MCIDFLQKLYSNPHDIYWISSLWKPMHHNQVTYCWTVCWLWMYYVLYGIFFFTKRYFIFLYKICISIMRAINFPMWRCVIYIWYLLLFFDVAPVSYVKLPFWYLLWYKSTNLMTESFVCFFCGFFFFIPLHKYKTIIRTIMA